jgi:hypothetical protein
MIFQVLKTILKMNDRYWTILHKLADEYTYKTTLPTRMSCKIEDRSVTYISKRCWKDDRDLRTLKTDVAIVLRDLRTVPRMAVTALPKQKRSYFSSPPPQIKSHLPTPSLRSLSLRMSNASLQTYDTVMKRSKNLPAIARFMGIIGILRRYVPERKPAKVTDAEWARIIEMQSRNELVKVDVAGNMITIRTYGRLLAYVYNIIQLGVRNADCIVRNFDVMMRWWVERIDIGVEWGPKVEVNDDDVNYIIASREISNFIMSHPSPDKVRVFRHFLINVMNLCIHGPDQSPEQGYEEWDVEIMTSVKEAIHRHLSSSQSPQSSSSSL